MFPDAIWQHTKKNPTPLMQCIFLISSADSSLEGLLQYEVIHPQRVDSTGHFISNLVSHRVSRIRRRQTEDSGESLPHVFYNLQYGGQELHFNLSLNPHLLAPGFLTERRYGGLQGSTLHSHGHSVCYFLGEVWSSSATKGQAAVSTCDGLTGLFKLSEEEFFIRPLEQPHGTAKPQAHVIYKRDTSQTDHQLVQPLQRERWEKRQHRRRQRSISREKWVETLVVADPKMVEYHGRNGVESYVLSVMNIVAGLFHDSSIGNAINIVVVRLILLEQDEEDLKITHHADNSLNSFCKWQKHLNMKGDDHPVHHDVAVLLTRKDICAATNKPCETLGLSHVAGMCQPHRSCSINEDTGLPLAFTVAHELGHNFGIQHDGNGNDCEPVGKRPFVMSPQLLYGNSPPNWSRCSRQYITRFLDRGWGWCLDDPPRRNELANQSVLPGVLYSAAHQCRLQYGSSSLLCDDVDDVCSTLWCTVDSTCHSKLDGAVDGTKCGEGKVRQCIDLGECVPVGLQPEKVDGGWGPWSEWSPCTRTCGAGIQSQSCVLGHKLNTTLYLYKNINMFCLPVHPCELHCRPLSEHFSEKMVDAVIDGTQCYEGTQSRDMCINGICKNIGCDYEIDSNAVEDRCGVCQGNGSTCETVKKTFEDSEGLGYVDIGLIPEGARDIHIEEVAEAGNFLALRSNDPEKYFLNGGWTIQWNGEYKAAGTVFTYERTGQLENLTSPGPTMEPVWIQLLFQETNPGVRYEYTISREILPESINGTPAWDFQWKHGAWTECSATCGTGFKRQVVHCIERMSGIVEEHYCDPATRPDDKRVHCRAEPCPALWWTGAWQKCSSTCGEWGLTKRTVVCIRSLGLDEQEALQPSECQHLPRPEPLTRCSAHIPCPADWTTGNWSECSASCAGGVQVREVTCSWNTGVDCDHQAKPASSLSCNVQECPVNVVDLEWSGSGSSSKEPPLWTSTELQTSIMPDTPDTTIPAVTSWSEQWATAAPSVNWTEIDNNEIIVPPVLWVGNPSSPDPSPTQSQVPSTQTPGSIEPDTCSPLPSTSSAFWSTGNWSDVSNPFLHRIPLIIYPKPKYMQMNNNEYIISGYHKHGECIPGLLYGWIMGALVVQCSTTCGLGAIWRSVQCSTGNDSECDVAKRPAPARRCYIRPCSAWRLGQWTKCSKNCGGGVKLREIQCYALRDQRPLRPFHCQAALPRPLIRLPCNSHPCLDWYSSSWGQCSELCGGGEQQRLVTCPEDERCDEEQKPSNIQPCNIQPCSQWITGSWGQCSVSCGGGVQRRLVKCVNIKEEEGKEEEEEQAQCDHEPWPENMRQCNLQDCDSQLCLRDRLTFRFCQTLQWLGRCDQAAVQAQCCKTCEQQHQKLKQCFMLIAVVNCT
uniref:ADAM metallopeptidase with thrombospondin type 1 motif 7 n=1 Tax=Astyanax mexicanus TaxID=7994 RepID=A0A8B9L350_ASTMX